MSAIEWYCLKQWTTFGQLSWQPTASLTDWPTDHLLSLLRARIILVKWNLWSHEKWWQNRSNRLTSDCNHTNYYNDHYADDNDYDHKQTEQSIELHWKRLRSHVACNLRLNSSGCIILPILTSFSVFLAIKIIFAQLLFQLSLFLIDVLLIEQNQYFPNTCSILFLYFCFLLEVNMFCQ